MSLEDAARATKIREKQLADLEADDYSNFANLAYARSFLANYGKYLRVDVRPHVESFSDASTFGLDDYQYLSERPVGMYRIPYRRSSRTRRLQRRQLIGAALGLAALAVGGLSWFLIVSIQRLGPLDRLAARQEAREKAGREGTPSADTATAAVPAASPAAVDVDASRSPVLPAPGGVIPVSAPTADTPAPSASPAPAELPTQVSVPALASAVEPTTSSLALPVSGEPPAARELLTAHTAQSQPQKVVNDRPRGR